MNDVVIQTIQNLIELHSLEDQLEHARTGKTDIQTKVDAVRVKLIPNILGHHDRMRARGKRSIAEVRNGCCTACHMGLAIGILATLRHMDDIQICANCGRYLFLQAAPEPAPEPAPAPEAPKVAAKPARKKRVKVVKPAAE